MITKINEFLFVIDKTNLYKYAIVHGHELANSQGKVYEHIYVMSMHLGYKIPKGYVVHHVDRDRSNNELSNLMLMTNEDHVSLHAREDKGVIIENRSCVCGNVFSVSSSSERKFCCQNCAKKSLEKVELSSSELKRLVWEFPMTQLSDMLGISDVAIKKRCKKNNIETPPRGFFLKKKSSRI